MKSRGRVRAVFGACALAVITFAGPAFVVSAAAQNAPTPEPKKLDKAQLQEAQALSEAMDSVLAGKPAPSDIPVKVESIYYFRGANGRTYVPFTLVLDPASLASPDISFMVRAVKKGAASDPAAGTGKDAKQPALTPGLAPEFVTLKPEGASAKLSRAFQVPAGDYDLWVAVKEKNPADKKQKAKVTVYRQDLTVPDYTAAAGFVTSAVVVTDKMDVLPAVLKPEQQRESPYTLGQLQLVPKLGTTFAKNQELCIYYQIYNAGVDSANKPDVLIEYEFLQKQPGGGEKKIVNADPQVLNAGSLPQGFDATKHLLAGPEAWPLSAFPVGEYKLNVKITDKPSGKTLTHTVNFTVTAAS
ncbi:MAG: hypothetical protein ACM3NQ_13020 [Bacteroidales bacterium]